MPGRKLARESQLRIAIALRLSTRCLVAMHQRVVIDRCHAKLGSRNPHEASRHLHGHIGRVCSCVLQ
jgi:hypothetical protein